MVNILKLFACHGIAMLGTCRSIKLRQRPDMTYSFHVSDMRGNKSRKPIKVMGARWPSGKASDSKSRGPGFDPHKGHRVVSLSKTH